MRGSGLSESSRRPPNNKTLLHRRDRGNHQTSGLQSDLLGTESRAEKDLDGDELHEPRRPYQRLPVTPPQPDSSTSAMDKRSPLTPSINVCPSPFKTSPDPDPGRSKNSTARSSSPADSQDIIAAQDDEESETELPSLDSLLGLNPTYSHSNSEDTLRHNSLTTSTPQVQGRAEVPGSELDAQAPPASGVCEARWSAAFALEDKPVTSGNSPTSKRLGHSTGKCPECGADVRPSPKRQPKRLSARQRRAFCEAHRQKAAKTEWTRRRYPQIKWGRLDARLQQFSPALRDILNRETWSFYRSELRLAAAKGVKRQFRCMDNATAGYYGPRGKQVM
jgi:hypothetical protein